MKDGTKKRRKNKINKKKLWEAFDNETVIDEDTDLILKKILGTISSMKKNVI
mgnify:CR=1 FL=1